MQKDIKEKPLHFYVANLGSEIQRMLSWKEKGDMEAMHNARKRALAIIATVKNFGNSSASAEMDILEKALEEDILSRDQAFSYFSPFALRTLQSIS